MLNSELIAELLQRDPNGEVQIYGSEQAVEVQSYWDVEKVDGFINSPDTVIHMGKKRHDIILTVSWQGQDYGIKLGQPVRYLGADDGKGGVRTASRSGQVGVVDEVLIARDNRSGRFAGVTVTVEFPDGDIPRSLAYLHQLEFL